ncbi:MAG: hypothetical protein KGQ86_03015 [Bacteroidetes bacterium]|nr:hypothetical protein [Bacteroidota bacterium]
MRILLFLTLFLLNNSVITFAQNNLNSKNKNFNDCPPEVKDIDGNVYKTVKIGRQCWMKSNLKVTKYRDNSIIPKVTDNMLWANLTKGARCSFDNNIMNSYIYGNLYNWFAVSDNRQICPTGWRVPTDNDWTNLTKHLGGNNSAGKIKASGFRYWNKPNLSANNESGFTALPAGRRNYDGSFSNLKYHTYFWTKNIGVINTTAWNRNIFHDIDFVSRVDSDMNYGFSVRCIKE